MRPYIFKLIGAAQDEAARFSAWVKARGLAADDWITLSGRDSNGDKHGGARVLLDDNGAIVYGLGGGHEGKKLSEAFSEIRKKQDVRGQGSLFNFRADKRRDKKEDGGKLEREREALKERGKEQEAQRAQRARADYSKEAKREKQRETLKSEIDAIKEAADRTTERTPKQTNELIDRAVLAISEAQRAGDSEAGDRARKLLYRLNDEAAQQRQTQERAVARKLQEKQNRELLQAYPGKTLAEAREADRKAKEAAEAHYQHTREREADVTSHAWEQYKSRQQRKFNEWYGVNKAKSTGKEADIPLF